MRRSNFIIFALFSLLLCVLAGCAGREETGQSPHVSESVQFQTGGQSASAPVQQIQQPQQIQAGHTLYMTGEDGLFRPNDPVTRGQMAQILCGLLGDGGNASGEAAAFSDVSADSSAYASVARLASLGVVGGYGDGTFRPDEPITRSETVSVLCRMMNVSEVTALAFPDVPAEHWAMGSVAAAMTSGWLSGYQDGGFYPDAPLTRAEAAVLIDRAVGRTPNKTAIDAAYAESPYTDVPKDFWAYYDIVDVSAANELLAYIMGETENASQGMILLDGRLCHVNAELRLDYFQKGFHTIQDGLATDGLYYAPEDGYFLLRNQPGLQELDGSMFYVLNADGPFVTNYDLGYLHFGDNGRYTSGDLAVDGYVDAIMADIIQGDTASLLNEEKLRQAYDYLLYGDYDYMTRPVGWKRGTTVWSLECAKTMYETKRGSCYFWAASFLYLARRLGFQAYPVCGGVNQYNALHAWVMIDHGDIDDNDVNTEESKNEATRVIDPDEYIYDIELDWAYRTGAHGRTPIRPGRDLFKQDREHPVVHYIFPGDTWYAPPMDDTDVIDTEGNENEDNGENGGDLFDDGNGGELTEGTDYNTSYVNNGDGTITVTITYLTGDQAGTVTSYTVLDPDYTGEPTVTDPPAVTDAPVVTDEPVEEPTVTDEPVEEPTVTDEPVEEPTVTDEPVEEPTVTDEPAEEPTVTDEPVEEPTVTDEPVEEPTVTDEPVEEPTVTDEPVEEPTVTDEPVEEQPGDEEASDGVIDDGEVVDDGGDTAGEPIAADTQPADGAVE